MDFGYQRKEDTIYYEVMLDFIYCKVRMDCMYHEVRTLCDFNFNRDDIKIFFSLASSYL